MKEIREENYRERLTGDERKGNEKIEIGGRGLQGRGLKTESKGTH